MPSPPPCSAAASCSWPMSALHAAHAVPAVDLAAEQGGNIETTVPGQVWETAHRHWACASQLWFKLFCSLSAAQETFEPVRARILSCNRPHFWLPMHTGGEARRGDVHWLHRHALPPAHPGLHPLLKQHLQGGPHAPLSLVSTCLSIGGARQEFAPAFCTLCHPALSPSQARTAACLHGANVPPGA